jgi:PAS domain S-box-containing protein
MSESKTILLVEDEAVIALCESELLEENGYRVVAVSTGEDAVQSILHGAHVDLVLMDIDLGAGIDGTEASLLIAGICDVPVVFLSGNTEPGIVDRADKISSYGYIAKSSGETVLLDSIRMAFRLHAANREIKHKNMELTLLNSDDAACDSLRERDEKYRSIVDNTSDYIMRYDREGRHTFGNRSALAVTGVTLEEYVGKTHRDLGFPDHLCRLWEESLDAVFQTGHAQSVEFEIDLADGKKYLQLKLCPEFSPAGEVKSVIGISRDLTERKRLEEKIENSMHEKKLLIQEMHHRVKNNMNVIMSLLSIQSGIVAEPSAAAVLNDARTRLLSMAILYDRLYSSENSNAMSVLEYLTALVSEVVALFPNAGKVMLETDIHDFFLDGRTLSTLGIMVNELITNTMKHAFNGESSGVIKLALRKYDSYAVLQFEDNGRGIPESLELKKSPGFGLQLVDRLSLQLKGSVQVLRGNGTKFIVEFAC